MANAEEATARRPPRRRAPWSLRSIVVEVTGKPMSEFQDVPPPHPRSAPAHPVVEATFDDIDPVEHFCPPLSGARAREVHGPKMEHHAATLERHRPGAIAADPLHALLPPHPEQLYLHYLLLHLDRLSIASLWYLRRQVNDEIAARARPPPSPLPTE